MKDSVAPLSVAFHFLDPITTKKTHNMVKKLQPEGPEQTVLPNRRQHPWFSFSAARNAASSLRPRPPGLSVCQAHLRSHTSSRSRCGAIITADSICFPAIPRLCHGSLSVFISTRPPPTSRATPQVQASPGARRGPPASCERKNQKKIQLVRSAVQAPANHTAPFTRDA